VATQIGVEGRRREARGENGGQGEYREDDCQQNDAEDTERLSKDGHRSS
jgi:hypothetical protein